MALEFKRKPIIYSFGPEGRDACWAALTKSFNQLGKHPAFIMQPVQTTDNSQCDSQSSEVLKESRKDSGLLSNLSDMAQTSSVETNDEKCDVTTPPQQLPEPPEFVSHINCLVVDDHKCNHVDCWPDDLALVDSNNKHDTNDQNDVEVLSEDHLHMQMLLQQTPFTNDFEDWTYIESGRCEDIEKQLLSVARIGSSALQEPSIEQISPETSFAEKTLVADDVIETSFDLSTSPSFVDGNDYNYCYRTNIELFYSSKLQPSYEARIKEIDNNILSFCKLLLSSVLFVILLRILF